MNWRNTLAEALQRSSPQHICALDVAALAIARDLLPEAPVQLCEAYAQNTSPAQLAVVMGALNDLDAAQARTLLARVRDFISPRIIVIAGAHCPLDRLAFLAIGYDTLSADEAAHVALYQFDLNTYKQVPDWLNARYWAHPERWKP